ncbi:hypothetical protein JCM17092_26310 [Haloplanus litoreus]
MVVPSAENLFESDCRDREQVAVDFDLYPVGGERYYVWAAVDYEMS